MRIASFAIAAFLLSSCELADAPGYDAEDVLAEYRLEWRQLSDGSHFGRAGNSSDDNQFGIRCWPWEDDLLRCVEAQAFRAAGISNTSVSIGYHSQLPEIMMSAGTSTGYGCSYLMDYTEEISRAGDALVSNRIRYGQRRWSRSYVNKFMADNGVDGQQYYDCLQILEAVNRGSMETLSTTEVNEGMLE